MRTSTIKNRVYKEKVYMSISVITLIVLWKLLSLWVAKEIIIPSPESTFKELIRIINDENFILSIFNTLKRTVIGFVFAFTVATILGMLSGFFKPIYYLLKPLVLVNKSIPTMSIILIALIWLTSELAPILVGFLVIFPVLYSSVVLGVKNIDPHLIEMAALYKINKMKMIKEIYLPSIKSNLITSSSLAIGLNLKIIIAAEVLSQPKISIGTSFFIEKSNLNTAGVFAWSVVAIILAGTLDWIITIIKNRDVGF